MVSVSGTTLAARARDYIAGIPRLDWRDLEAVHAQTSPVLKALAQDRATLAALVEQVALDPSLFAMSERHFLLDYFVLHDAPERRFRLRLHIHTENHAERPHNHRFPFTTYILRGSYLHSIHYVRGGLSETTCFEDLSIAYRTRECAGASYTISHDTVHTTYTDPGTISLVLRGPALLENSIIMDRNTHSISWRQGRHQESSERRAKVAMTRAGYNKLVAKLRRLEVI